MLHAARWKCRTQKVAKNPPSGHNCTNLSGYIFVIKACIDNRENSIKQQCLPHMSSQCGELRPTSGWDLFSSLGHSAHFNGIRVLAALLQGTLVMGVSQTLWRWTEGATYIRQGGHRVGIGPHSCLFYFRCGSMLKYSMKPRLIQKTFFLFHFVMEPRAEIKKIRVGDRWRLLGYKSLF